MNQPKTKKRKGKKTDQINTERAYQILMDAMVAHPEIEPTLWSGACWTALVNGYLNTDIPFDIFKRDWQNALDHYEKWWDKN